MTDIVARLRERADNCDPDWRPADHRLWDEAADEIERLEERVADLQAQCGYTESIKALEIERLNAARHADSQRMVRMSDEYEAAQDEIERLRARNAAYAGEAETMRDERDEARRQLMKSRIEKLT